jgi:hypothetical protein
VQSDGDASDSCGVACVTGLGPSRRIVISDTALAHYSEREMRSIVSHEMKHYIKDDNVKAFVVVSALLLVGLWLADRLGRVAVEGGNGASAFPSSPIGHRSLCSCCDASRSSTSRQIRSSSPTLATSNSKPTDSASSPRRTTARPP